MERTSTARGRKAWGMELLAEGLFKGVLESSCVRDKAGIDTFVQVLAFVSGKVGRC